MKTHIKEEWQCSECGADHPKWSGICYHCQKWHTIVLVNAGSEEEGSLAEAPRRLADISSQGPLRFEMGWEPIDRLMGGGFVRGSLSLIVGPPGVGKSTLMLQLCHAFALQKKKVLYITAEESVEQTAMRARRLAVDGEYLYLCSETRLSKIAEHLETYAPELLIIDSAQVVGDDQGTTSAPGSAVQVKRVAMACMGFAKGMKVTTLLVGHVTKEGDLAGPRALEHLVDTVLEFEGDQKLGIRLLRCQKNRFGSVDEIALFEMTEQGLKRIDALSHHFVEHGGAAKPGIALTATLEGSRSFLVEAQALVAKTYYPNPTRRFTSLDSNRIHLLLAVLEKRFGYPLHTADVFATIVGGIKIVEPAIDLALLLAVASSFRNLPLIGQSCFLGEVSLSGHVRAVARCQLRLEEAVRMGLKTALIPKKNIGDLSGALKTKISLIGVDNVEEAIRSAVDISE